MYIWWDTKPEFIVRDDRDYGERWSQKDGFLWSVAMLFWWMDRDVRRDAGRGAHVREPRLLLILFVECHNIWQRPFRTRHLSSQRTTKVFFSLDRLQFSGRLIRQSVNKNHVLNEMRPRIPRPLFLKHPPPAAYCHKLWASGMNNRLGGSNLVTFIFSCLSPRFSFLFAYLIMAAGHGVACGGNLIQWPEIWHHCPA